MRRELRKEMYNRVEMIRQIGIEKNIGDKKRFKLLYKKIYG